MKKKGAGKRPKGKKRPKPAPVNKRAGGPDVVPSVVVPSVGHRFQVGNPGGPGNPFAGYVQALRVSTFSEVGPEVWKRMLAAMVKKAMAGDVDAFRAVADRVMGKPPQGVYESDETGAPTDESRMQRFARILKEHGLGDRVPHQLRVVNEQNAPDADAD